jgi:low affinity Fe/Cu permease
MALKRTNGTKNSSNSHGRTQSDRNSHKTTQRQQRLDQSRRAAERTQTEWFSSFAHAASRIAGKPIAFILATAAVLVWATTGPYFGYSDTWQLVINTSTTIITFLMVFLIQNTQNRDMLAVQAKLAELIIAVEGAKNKLAIAEDMSEEDLEKLHAEYCSRADAAREHLERRRAAHAQK